MKYKVITVLLASGLLFSGCKMKQPENGQSAEAKQKVQFLNGKQISDLLVEKVRWGKTRNSQKGVFFQSILKKNGKAHTVLVNKEGKVIQKVPDAKWGITKKGALCIQRVVEKKTITSCRMIYKKDENTYRSILLADKKLWSEFRVLKKTKN